jgi:hypothetical protein
MGRMAPTGHNEEPLPHHPDFCGLVLLLVALSKYPEVKPVKPTLLILAVSGLVYGALEYMLNDQSSRGYVGHRIAGGLYRLKFTVGGIGIGAALTSLFYGHWTSAWLAAIQRQQRNDPQKKID